MTWEEVPKDMGVYQQTLDAQLAGGTDRRVAEGRARSKAIRANSGDGMIWSNSRTGSSDTPSRASTVLAVGSKMSMTRLCVRISNCSRDFLSMCGLRSTV